MLEWAGVLLRTKHARYCAVSANAVVVTQVLLTVFVHGLGWRPAAANVAAVSLSCIPSFLLNRTWVWKVNGRARMGRQGVVFWAMALLGLALSTVTVAALDAHWSSPVVANVGNLAAFGALWVAKFVVLDRVLFRAAHEPAAATVAP